MKKLYAALWFAFVSLVYFSPANAILHHGGVVYANTCGSQPVGQNWCVNAATGYTVFTATNTTNAGTCNTNGTGTSNGTCVVPVSSSLGNDSTCSAQVAGTSGSFTSDMLSTFSPGVTPCATLSKAQTLLRNNKADWLVLLKGDTWVGGINGAANDVWTKSGLSTNQPMVVAAYGVGARPLITQSNSNDLFCFETAGTNGQFIAFTGLRCYKAVHDPASPSFQGATITADTGVANCGAATTICNINAGTGLPAQLFTTASYSINGNGINNLTPTGSIGAGTTSITMNGSASFTATQMKVQIQDRQVHAGVTLNGITNFLIVEDCEFDYGAMGTVGTGAGNPLQVVNYFVRRNAFNGSTSNGANLFLPPNCPSAYASPCSGGAGQVTIEENASNFAAWNPNIWAYPATSLLHAWYLHDPSVPVYIHGNTVGNNASDNQYRDGGTAVNNLFYTNSIAFSANVEDNQTTMAYNVAEANNDNIIALRTATASPGSSGTVLSIDGVLSAAVGGNVVDLSNSGAIPNTTTISSVRDGFSANLSHSIVAGINGNGVQAGDIIEIFSGNGVGILQNTAGSYLDNGPATSGAFPIGSTVSVSAASPGIVTETGATFSRSQDEPFQFTSGTLPTGLALSTTYCADPANGSATAYPVYLATGGLCPGGTDINTTGSPGSGIVRTGSRKFTFSISEGGLPAQVIPTWVTVGMSVFDAQSTTAFPQTISGLSGGTTVQSISSDRTTLITTDASVGTINGSNPVGNGKDTFLFGVPSNPNYPTSRIGPNNLFIHLASQTTASGGGAGNAAITLQATSSGNNASGNYIYNWNRGVVANNTNDSGFPSTNLPAIGSSQVLNSGTTAIPDVRFPLATIESYDASVRGGSFNGTVTGSSTFNSGVGSSYDGATLTVNSGVAPSIGDMVFCTGCTQYMTIVSGTGPFIVSAPPGTMVNVGPIAMTNGSFAHFISQALLQSKDAGWNPVYAAATANNYIRTQIQCGNQTTFPGSPACPAQN